MIRRVRIFFAWAVLSVPCAAWAQGNEPQAKAPPEALVRFQEGKALQTQGKVVEARAKYLQSLALYAGVNTLFNLMALEEVAGRYGEAMKYARMYRKHPKADPKGMADLREHYWEPLLAKTAHLTVVAQGGELVILDGANLGKAPLDDVVDVMPGKHVFESGGKRVEVEAQAGQSKEVSLQVEAKVPQPAGVVAPAAPKTPNGPAEPARDERSAADYAVPIAVGGVGIVGLVLGGVFAAGSNGAKKDAEALGAPGACRDATSQGCSAYRDRIDSQNGKDTLSKIMLVTGSVVTAAGVALLVRVLWPKSEAKGSRALNWSPWVGRDTQGLALEGIF
jgi:hypothetical protein